MAEAACILGFVQSFIFHAPIMDYAPFGLGAIAVIGFDAIPVGLQYWNVWERQQSHRPGAPPLG